MSRYRFYSRSESRHMLAAVDRHISKVGTPLKAEAICAGKGTGWYELVVTGTAGKLVLRGCSWGYSGEGSRATRDVLVRLGIGLLEAEELAFRTPNADVGGSETVRSRRGKFRPATAGKVYFKVHLLPQPKGWFEVAYRNVENMRVMRKLVEAFNHADAINRAGSLDSDRWTACKVASPFDKVVPGYHPGELCRRSDMQVVHPMNANGRATL